MPTGIFVEDYESLLDAFDDYEWDESDDEFDDEAVKKPRFRPMKAPSTATKSSYQARPSQYVTQTQLQTTVSKLDGKISALSKSTVQQVNSVKKEQAKQIALLKKEAADRKKESETLRKELRQFRDISMLLPLLSKPSSQTLTADAGGIPAGTKVLVDKNDTLSALLPLILMGGFGGSSSSSGGGGLGGDGDNSMMMLVLLMAMSK